MTAEALALTTRDSGQQRSRTEPRRDAALLSLGALILIGFVFAMLYSLVASGWMIVSHLVVAGLTAGAATMVGGLLGFLFGIPRSFPEEPTTEAQKTAGASGARAGLAYRPNTSLEQISDWLTKILVGVGLTQIDSLQTRFASLGHQLGLAFGGNPIDESFVTTLVAMLLVCGFLFGFLWTRIYLPSAFRAADLDAVRGEVRQELGRQADLDAEALNLVEQQLQSTPGQASIAEEKLASAIAQASLNARLLAFERARENRAKNWQDPGTKPLMERSTPIFKALIQCGTDSPIAHRYYGQLGFALKDQTKPDYKAAEEALTTAIHLRGPAETFGYPYYELNRAICRIMLDQNFAQKKPSDTGSQAAIVVDLGLAYRGGLAKIVRQEDPIVKWMAINGRDEASLATRV